MRHTAIFVVSLVFGLASPVKAEDLTVLQDSAEGTKPGQQLEVYLKQEFYAQVDRRL